MQAEVSIITVYFNSPEEILRLQESIRNHLGKRNIEWIVADNHSNVDLSKELAGSIYLRFSENLGFGKANNRASEHASAPYLFFVNPDCIFLNDCLDPLVRALATDGVAGPRVLNQDGSLQLSFGPFLTIRNELIQKKRIQREKTPEMQEWIRSRGFSYPDYVSGCALMVRAELYRKIEGFDENFFLYEEDVDLCKRIRDLGYRTAYVPDAEIIHERNTTVNRDRHRADTEYRKSQTYYYRKHNGLLQNAMLALYLRSKSSR